MRWRRAQAHDDSDRISADLFAGFLISMLVFLVVVVLQTVEIRDLRRINDVFQHALQDVATTSAEFDFRDGRIVVRAQSLFRSGSFKIDQSEADLRFGAARTALVNVLESIKRNLGSVGGGLEATQYVEVRVIGHTDCQPFAENSAFDNMDLSALRGVALAKYLTAPCPGTPGVFECCADEAMPCPAERISRRIDPSVWTVLPSGRGSFEPRDLTVAQRVEYPSNCNDFSENELQSQRRVVIEIVPRIDKIMVENSRYATVAK